MTDSIRPPLYDVGVIVARFQTASLHKAHIDLIQHVVDRHSKVIIVLARAVVLGTRKNPLDFQARKQMVLERFPDVIVLPIKDIPGNDELWSKRLDELIEDQLTPFQTPLLYGSRDSFIPHYTGRYNVEELEPTVVVSATSERERIARSSVVDCYEFRAGAVWQAYNRHPTSFQTVDVVIFDDTYQQMLMGFKSFDGDALRFVGGFVEPRTPSLEANVRREAMEETHLEITDPVYIGSSFIDDQRYTSIDGIMTAFFAAKVLSGRAEAGDDLDGLKWVNTIEAFEGTSFKVVETHKPLVPMARNYWYKARSEMR